MSNLNKATLIGHAGRDPEMNATRDGREVANFSIATTEKWTDKATGEKKEETTWHNIVAFGRLAEIVGQYVTKGKAIYVEGKIKHEKYTGIRRISRRVRMRSSTGEMNNRAVPAL